MLSKESRLCGSVVYVISCLRETHVQSRMECKVGTLFWGVGYGWEHTLHTVIIQLFL